MMWEFARLSKAEESGLMSVVQKMESFSLVPNGFSGHKEELLTLADQAVGILQRDPPDQHLARCLARPPIPAESAATAPPTSTHTPA